jgi:hypothetical protein
VEVGRTGFAGRGVAVGIREGIREGLGVGTWTVTAAWAVFPAWSLAWNSTVWLPSVLIVAMEPSCQDPPSKRTWTSATPEVASLAVVITTTGDVYQPPFPSAGEAEAFREGGTESIWIVTLVVVKFPALSLALAVREYTPSDEAVKVALPPLMLTLAMPEVASVAEAVAVTGPEVNQPFEPFGVGIARAREGAALSTWYAAFPGEEDRLPPPAAIAVKEADPDPSGRVCEQEEPEQENGVPLMLPETVSG